MSDSSIILEYYMYTVLLTGYMMLQILSNMKTGEIMSFNGYLAAVDTHTDINSRVSESVPNQNKIQ